MTLDEARRSPYLEVMALADTARKARKDGVSRFTFPSRVAAQKWADMLHVRVPSNHYCVVGPEVYVIGCPDPQRKAARRAAAVED